MTNIRIICALLFAAAAVGAALAPAAQAAENDFNVRVVLFIQDGADPPQKYQERLESLAVRTEAFFAQWMKHWKRPVERKQVFARTKDGSVEVSLVRGKVRAQGRDALAEIRKQAVAGATRARGIEQGRPVVWWILYDYPNVRGFRGGSRGMGGIAINAYPKGSELIGKDAELASPKMAEMAIKGTIHELGHALGLPHIGSRPSDKLGNSLMGPVNNAYWRQTRTKDQRVYLSEVGAAMLWKHPIFRREAVRDYEMPKKVELKELKVTESDSGGKLMITGKLLASLPAHTAVVVDSQRGRFGDYWERPYAGEIDAKTGRFKITVSEPFERGTLYLSFCFLNGTVTADGRRPFQHGSSIEIFYSGEKGSRRFELPSK